MISLGFVALLLIILIAVSIFVYKLVYTHNINKKILSGEIQGRKMVDISRMVTIAVIVVLLVYAGIATVLVNDYANYDYSIPRNNYAVIDVSDPENYNYVAYFEYMSSDDASYALVYNKENNPGYEKEEIESGDFVFTVFTRTSSPDNFHPDFLCYVDYVGEEKDKYSCYNKAGFCAFDEEESYTYFGSLGDIPESILYIGNLDESYMFQINMALLDKEGEEKYDQANEELLLGNGGEIPDEKDFAVSIGSVTITMGR